MQSILTRIFDCKSSDSKSNEKLHFLDTNKFITEQNKVMTLEIKKSTDILPKSSS